MNAPKETTTASGGSVAKRSGLYEWQWTVMRGVVPVLMGQFEGITVEPPGLDGVGTEFLLDGPHGSEVHQAKRSHKTRWTITALDREHLIGAFFNHLGIPGRRVIFVSGTETSGLTALSRKAASLDDLATWLRDTNPERTEREQLKAMWRVDDATLHTLLSRITVEGIQDTTLAHQVTDVLAGRIEGDPDEVFDYVRSFLENHLNERLTAHDLWSHLRQRGFGPRPGGPNPAMSERARDLAQRYAVKVNHRLPLRLRRIPRPVEDELTALVKGPPVRAVAVTGRAGAGKSTVCAALVDRLLADGVVVAAFSMDQPGLAGGDQDIGVHAASGFGAPVVRVMAAAAAGKRCVLVIDQLDAVSMTSGRGEQEIHGLWETLRGTSGLDTLCVVVACRSHDLHYDPRLRELLATAADPAQPRIVEIGELTDDQIDGAMTDLGVSAATVGNQLRALLRLPFNLKLLAEIVHDAHGRDENLDLRLLYAQIDLLQAYHQSRRRVLRDRLSADRYHDVVCTVARRMSIAGALSLSRTGVEDVGDTVDALLSDGVLVENCGQVQFFHQFYFAYVFALGHLLQGKTAASLLAGDVQDLPRRGQTRMILALQRAMSPADYVQDLRAVLLGPCVRTHIRTVVLDGLAEIDHASDDELGVVLECAAGMGVLQRRAVRLLASASFGTALKHADLFQLIAREILTRLTTTNPNGGDVAALGCVPTTDLLYVLTESARHSSAAAVAGRALATHPRAVTEYCGPLLHLVLIAGATAGPDTAALLRDVIITVTALATAAPTDLPDTVTDEAIDAAVRVLFGTWAGTNALHTVTLHTPDQALDLYVAWLRAAAQIAAHRSQPSALQRSDEAILPSQPSGLDTVTLLSAREPVAWAAGVIPFLLEQADRTAHDASPWRSTGSRDGPGLRGDRIWCGGHQDSLSLADELCGSAVRALQTVSRDHPARGLPIFTQLANSDLLLAQCLLAAAYQACHPSLLDDALAWAHNQQVRGLLTPGDGGADWAGVLAHIAATGTPTQRGQAVALALDSYTDTPTGPQSPDLQAASPLADTRLRLAAEQHDVLTRLASALGENTPAALRAHVDALSDLLGPTPPSHPLRALASGLIPNQIPDARTQAFTDDDWIDAITTLATAAPHPLFAGAPQVAAQLGVTARTQPTRFATLLPRLAPPVDPIYPSAVLGAFASPTTPPPDNQVRAVLTTTIRTVFDWPGHPHLQDLCSIISVLAPIDIPEDLLEILDWIAQHAKDPRTELWLQPTPGGDPYYGGNISHAALNCDRGAAVNTITTLLSDPTHRADRTRQLLPTITAVLRDPRQQVRVLLPAALLQLAVHDAPAAADLAGQWLDSATEPMLRPLEQIQLAYQLSHTTAAVPQQIATRLLAAADDEIRRAGGVLAAALAIDATHPTGSSPITPAQGDALLHHAMTDTASRQGIAEHLARTIDDLPDDLPAPHLATTPAIPTTGSPGWRLLLELCDDDDPTVRAAAAQFVPSLRLPLQHYDQLFAHLAPTRGFAEHGDFLLRTLARRHSQPPTSVLTLCQTWHAVTREPRATATTGRYVADLVLAIHAQAHTTDTIRQRCLDLLDRLIESDINEADTDLDA